MANINELMGLGLVANIAKKIVDRFVAKNEDSEVASGATLTVAGTLNVSGTAQLGGVALSATAAEINRACDVSSRVVNTTVDLAVTEASHDDKVITLNDADCAVTLPSATGSGAYFRFVVGTAFTGGSITVAASTDDEFRGVVWGVDSDADTFLGYPALDADGFDTITLNGAAKGGNVGDYFEMIDVASGVWHIKGFITQNGGSEATPFSADITS